MTQFHATFRSVGNPDYGQTEPQSPVETFSAAGILTVAKAARDYIDRHNLGSGYWPRTVITDDAGQEIAQVSYNGRMFAAND
jgi:hypothetical protein